MFLPVEAITQDVRARMVAATDGAVYDDDHASDESKLLMILEKVKHEDVKGSRKHRERIFRESDDSLTEFMDTLASFRAWGLFLEAGTAGNEGWERLESILWKNVAEFCSRHEVSLPQNIASLISPQDLAAVVHEDDAADVLAEDGITEAELDRVMRIQSATSIRAELGDEIDDLALLPFVLAQEELDADEDRAADAQLRALTEESLSFLLSRYPDPRELFHILANTPQLLTLSSRLSEPRVPRGE